MWMIGEPSHTDFLFFSNGMIMVIIIHIFIDTCLPWQCFSWFEWVKKQIFGNWSLNIVSQEKHYISQLASDFSWAELSSCGDQFSKNPIQISPLLPFPSPSSVLVSCPFLFPLLLSPRLWAAWSLDDEEFVIDTTPPDSSHTLLTDSIQVVQVEGGGTGGAPRWTVAPCQGEFVRPLSTRHLTSYDRVDIYLQGRYVYVYAFV